MDMMDGTQWNSQDQSNPGDIYYDIGLDFPFGLLPGSADPLDTQMSGTDPSHSHNIPSTLSQSLPVTTTMSPSTMAAITSVGVHQPISAQMMAPPNEVLSELDARIHYLQQQRQQHQRQMQHERSQSHHRHIAPMGSYYNTNPVPPTPGSLDLVAGNPDQFFMSPEQPQQAFDNRFHSLKEAQDLSFTPLVSPAVTPLEQQFVDATFPITSNYFSPLTSPALHAQPDPSLMSEYRSHAAAIAAKSTIENGPVEPWNTPNMTAESSKKTRKTPAKSTRSKSKVAQSPISKPMRRRGTVVSVATSNPSIATQVINEAEADASKKRGRSAEMEENASVSPEALSDMPPPPLPRTKSATASPFIQPQNSKNEALKKFAGRPTPATPASLMRLPGSRTSSNSSPAITAITTGMSTPTVSPTTDDFTLPDSFEDVLGCPAIDTPMQGTLDTVPVAKYIAPLPSPMLPKPPRTTSSSVNASPQILPAGGSTIRKTPQLAPRTSGTSRRPGSIHASPALLPRISPNIQPMANGSQDLAAQLQHKSNYQRLVEGTVLPGVSYPSTLSDALVVKKTSHKIAEQGRRNRINLALQEIATLLPPVANAGKKDNETGSDSAGTCKKDGKGQNVPNSKASTVEQAIEYIKQLQQQVEAANKRVGELECQLKEKSADSTKEKEVITEVTAVNEANEVESVAVVEE